MKNFLQFAAQGTAILTISASCIFSTTALAQEKAGSNDLVHISQIIPTLEQLGAGWESNRICVLIEPLETPSEKADPGESTNFFTIARNAISNGHREAYAMLRYKYRDQNCIVWIQRWDSKEMVLSQNWDAEKPTNGPPVTLPQIGERVFHTQRHGLHQNIDFIRDKYSISVESGSTQPEYVEPLKHLAEVLDANFLKAQKGLQERK
jgi:hypothetical protein